MLLCLGIMACNNNENTIIQKANEASIIKYISDTWHEVDSTVQVQELKVLDIDTISEKGKLAEEVNFLFDEVKKIDDSIRSTNFSIETYKDLIRIKSDYGAGDENLKQELSVSELRLSGYKNERNIITGKWYATRNRIPSADSITPVAYYAQCEYKLTTPTGTKTEKAKIILNKDFTAIDRASLFDK